LAEKRCRYEEVRLNLARFEHHQPDYLRLNPNGYVPTLVHDGVPLIESTPINEYLDETLSNRPLVPNTPGARHAMRVWTKFIDETCLPAVVVPTWSQFLAPAVKSMTDDERDAALARVPLPERKDRWAKIATDGFSEQEFRDALAKLHFMAERLEAALKEREWLVGSDISLADINILPYVRRAREIDASILDPEKRPRLNVWLQRMRARDSYSEVYAELEAA